MGSTFTAEVAESAEECNSWFADVQRREFRGKMPPLVVAFPTSASRIPPLSSWPAKRRI